MGGDHFTRAGHAAADLAQRGKTPAAATRACLATTHSPIQPPLDICVDVCHPHIRLADEFSGGVYRELSWGTPTTRSGK